MFCRGSSKCAFFYRSTVDQREVRRIPLFPMCVRLPWPFRQVAVGRFDAISSCQAIEHPRSVSILDSLISCVLALGGRLAVRLDLDSGGGHQGVGDEGGGSAQRWTGAVAGATARPIVCDVIRLC